MSVCLESTADGRFSWNGKEIQVEVLHSRAGLAQHVWLENRNSALLVDCGDGCIRDIINNKLDLRKLQAILLTHGHFDHVGGLHSLLGFLRMIGRESTLNLVTPLECDEVTAILNSFLSVYKETNPFEIKITTLDHNSSIEIGEFKISSKQMAHAGSKVDGMILDSIRALGYCLEVNGERVAISGDTGICDGVRELVSDVDLAIIEATFENSSDVSEEAISRVHLAEDIAHELGRSAKQYLLVHKGKR